MTARTRGLWGAVVIGVVASLVILYLRWGVEARYRTVEIVLDGPDWESLALREGRDPIEVFAEARRRGATSVALYERTLKRLAERGEIAYLAGEQLRAEMRVRSLAREFAGLQSLGGPQPGTVYIAASAERLNELARTLAGLLGPSRVRPLADLIAVRGQARDLEELGLGFAREDLDRFRSLGLEPALRLRNYPGLTADGLQSIAARLRALGRGYPVVFEFVEVLGYERLVPEAADVLRSAGERYGRIEVFSVRRKQRGEERLAREMRPEVIRLFSLTPEELQVLPQAEARDKFVRGARERNIRLLYVRPFVPTAGIIGTESNLTFVGDLASGLRRFGLQPGRAVPLPVVRVPPALRGVAVLGALAAMGLALMFTGDAVGAPVAGRVVWALIGLGVFLTVLLAFAGPFTLWLKLLALGTAASLPAVGVLLALPRQPGGRPVAAGIRALGTASAVSVAGGLLVGGLLTKWEFMMAADVFLGVKIAQLVPVVLIVLLVWGYDRPPRSWRDTARELWAWSAHPLLLRYAVAAVGVGLAAVILLARSGNFGLPLLSIEERLRSGLEDLLVARPRTKEYLIGHPALVLAGAAAAAGWARWVLPLAAIGAVGQAGIVNSFSHIHTPLLYTLWRTGNALWLGALLGTLASAVLLAVAAQPRPPSPHDRRRAR